jgi:hypothetical protein
LGVTYSKKGAKVSIRLEVVNGDALGFPADVLALKFAQQLFGVDAVVVDRLERNGVDVRSRLPRVGATLRVNSGNGIAAAEALFVGVVPLGKFDYQTIREFAHSVLSTLGREEPSTQHVAMTLHGVGFGLDEAEAFRSEIAGVLDAVAANQRPEGLTRISIIERDAPVVERLKALLSSILSTNTIGNGQLKHVVHQQSLGIARGNLGAVGRDSNEKPACSLRCHSPKNMRTSFTTVFRVPRMQPGTSANEQTSRPLLVMSWRG